MPRGSRNRWTKAQKEAALQRSWAIGAYDTKDNFNHLKEEGIESAIKKIRKNASTKPRGPRARPAEVTNFKRQGYENWKKAKEYGQRWQAKAAFSIYKRTFGEHVSARKFKNMVNEIQLKVFAYNLLINGG